MHQFIEIIIGLYSRRRLIATRLKESLNNQNIFRNNRFKYNFRLSVK